MHDETRWKQRLTRYRKAYELLVRMNAKAGKELPLDEEGTLAVIKAYEIVFELSKETLAEIYLICRAFPPLQSVVLFSSRAKGTYTSASDIDLAVKGSEAFTYEEFSRLVERFGASDLPYLVDICNIDTFRNPALKDEIHRWGREIYRA